MWTGYYHKVKDSWVPALYSAPRWLEANGYGDLTDEVEAPDIRTPASGLFYVPSGAVIPAQWILTDATPGTGSLLQRFFGATTNEKTYLYPNLIQTGFSRQFFFDCTEPTYGWLTDCSVAIEKLEVLTSSGYVTISRADSDLDLFYSAKWKWKQEDSLALIYGLDIQIVEDYYNASGWHFLNSTETWDTLSLVFAEHPITKNWFPVHPTSIRSDGFVNFLHTGTMRFRATSSKAAKLLDTVTVKINGEVKQATRVNLSNSLDLIGLTLGIDRKFAESNTEYGNALLACSWFRGQRNRQLQGYLSAALRSAQVTTIPSGTTSYTFPATANGYLIRKTESFHYVSEELWCASSEDKFLTSIASGQLGSLFLDNFYTEFTQASGEVTVDKFINKDTDDAVIVWKVPYWTETSTGLVFSNNMPAYEPDLTILLTNKVLVSKPSIETLKKSFNRTSPIFKWRRVVDEIETPAGLADFDF